MKIMVMDSHNSGYEPQLNFKIKRQSIVMEHRVLLKALIRTTKRWLTSGRFATVLIISQRRDKSHDELNFNSLRGCSAINGRQSLL